MTTDSKRVLPSPDAARAYRRSVLGVVPLLLAVPVAFGLWFYLWGIPLDWVAIGAGAVGWLVALSLRAPVGLIAQRLLRTPERVQPWVVAASGPAEESVRLVTLLLVGRSFPIALWIGLGWSAIEVVYTIINGLALASLYGRTDEKSLQARQVLAATGMDKTLGATAPYLSVVERVFASALHIGLTLLLAWQPWLVLLTVPVHSGTNFLALRLMRRSMALSELAVAVIGSVSLVAGLAVFGHW